MLVLSGFAASDAVLANNVKTTVLTVEDFVSLKIKLYCASIKESMLGSPKVSLPIYVRPNDTNGSKTCPGLF